MFLRSGLTLASVKKGRAAVNEPGDSFGGCHANWVYKVEAANFLILQVTGGRRSRSRISMQISLSKSSEVPLWQQLAEQIVFLIAIGQLRPGQQLPSVRALARQVKVHHNTVSEAYQDLVRRQWLARQRGRRLVVGTPEAARRSPTSLDELINESIQRAAEMGYSLQALTDRVRQRLLAEPPTHILVIEEEPELRKVIQHEVVRKLRWPVKSCSPAEFLKDVNLAEGAQVFAPSHVVKQLEPFIPPNRPAISITFSDADKQFVFIRELKKPSVVATASVSRSILKTARGLFASAIGRRHTLEEVLVVGNDTVELRAADVAFCDSLAIGAIHCRRKIQYELVAQQSLEQLAAVLKPQ